MRKPRWMPTVAGYKMAALRTMAHDFQRTARILTRRDDIKVHLAPGGPAPGWSLGGDIYVNTDTATPMETDYEVSAQLGICKHEHGHVQYTPSPTAMRRVVKLAEGMMAVCLLADALENDTPGFRHVWNLLEDGRIETLLVAEYTGYASDLTNTFLHFIVADGKNLDKLFVLSRGRRYLPRKLRMRLRRKWHDKSSTKEIASIVDRYRMLNLSVAKDIHQAYHLVNRLVQILGADATQPQGMPHVCSEKELRNGGSDDKGAAQTRANATLKRQQRQDDKAEKRERQQAQAAGDDGEGDGKGKSSTAQAKPGDKGKERQPGKSAGEGESQNSGATEAEEEPRSAHGASSGEDYDGPMDGWDDGTDTDDEVMQSAKEEVSGRNDVRSTAGRLRGLARVQAGGASVTPRFTYWQPVRPGLPMHAQRIGRELRKVEEDADPHWRTHRPAGRMNVGRAMSAERNPMDMHDDLFDEWAEARITGTDVELVGLFDVSSSMSDVGAFGPLEDASWTIKRASDLHRVSCTEILYASQTAVVYTAQDKAHAEKMVYLPRPQRRANRNTEWLLGGGTDPTQALLDAHRILCRSMKKARVLVILTDGSWASRAPLLTLHKYFRCNEDIIGDLNARGIHTALAFLGNAASDSHGCAAYRTITSMDELVLFTREQVVKELRRKHR